MRSSLLLEIYGEEQEFHLLDIIPFTSARKRMSCVIKTPDNKIILYTKGADSVIFQRLNPRENPNELVSKLRFTLKITPTKVCVHYVLHPKYWIHKFMTIGTNVTEKPARQSLMIEKS